MVVQKLLGIVGSDGTISSYYTDRGLVESDVGMGLMVLCPIHK